MTGTDSPIEPSGDPDNASWHAALERGELDLGRCETCGRLRFPPMPACPFCGAAGAGLRVGASGLGSVYSWVIVDRALDPAFAAEVPYAVLAADLEEGPRVFARFRGDHAVLAAGLPVRFVPEKSAAGEAILCFEPAGG